MAKILISEAVKMGLEELERARKKFPTWPTDPIHAAAIVQEEAGELVKAAIEVVYPDLGKTALVGLENEDRSRLLLNEAIQTLAMSIRFIQNWPYDELIFTERKED